VLEILIGVFQCQQRVVSDSIIQAEVRHLDQAFNWISNRISSCSELLVLNLNLLVCWDLTLENEGKTSSPALPRGLFSLARSLSLRGWSGGKFMVVLIVLKRDAGS